MLLNGCLESIFIEISFDKKEIILVGLIYRHPHMLINHFRDNFLIECLNKIALLDNTCTPMCDFSIDLLKAHANNVTSKFLMVTSCFFVPYIQQPKYVVGSSTTLKANIFMNSVKFITVSGNI